MGGTVQHGTICCWLFPYTHAFHTQRGRTLGKMVEREILSHRLCSAHPHIVRFREIFLTPRYLAIAMEYAAGTAGEGLYKNGLVAQTIGTCGALRSSTLVAAHVRS